MRHFHERKMTVLKLFAHSFYIIDERKPSTNTQVTYDQNNHALLRRMRLQRDSL
jgi:hypothetical protein